MAPNETAVFVQSSEIEGQIRRAARQYAARRSAGQVGLENVALLHAARALDQFPGRHPGRRQDHAGLLPSPRYGPGARAPCAIHALVCEPLCALGQDLRHPIERFDILIESRAAEQADLCNVWWAVARIAPLAFDR